MTTRMLTYTPEPTLRFGHDQMVEDPRDGLALYGPLDVARPYGVRAGVIGTPRGIELYRRWVAWVQRPVLGRASDISRPVFPGFTTVFRAQWSPEPHCIVEVTDQEIDERLAISDSHQRVYGAVSLYAERILRANREDDSRPDLWFVIVPDRLRTHCTPESTAPFGSSRSTAGPFKSPAQARAFQRNMTFFQELEDQANIYLHEVDFHNQLKARLLPSQIVTQGVKEGTLANIASAPNDSYTAGEVAMQPDIAWRLSTAVYYKCGGRPWKLATVRPGVCYVGLVFKRDHTHADPRWACCAAQMFLDSGDGLVFKGALGPWHSPEKNQFHLGYEAARTLVEQVIASYREKTGADPSEVFIHGQASFLKDEMRGFEDAANGRTAVSGVTIKQDKVLKLFRSKGNTPILRGLSFEIDSATANLWTKGYVPRLGMYPGWEVPNSLRIQTRSSSVSIRQVVEDVLMLTKLDYNACSFGSGIPVTLKFANKVGEILTAAPFQAGPPPPLPFRHYI